MMHQRLNVRGMYSVHCIQKEATKEAHMHIACTLVMSQHTELKQYHVHHHNGVCQPVLTSVFECCRTLVSC
jgi:hypothetical protein